MKLIKLLIIMLFSNGLFAEVKYKSVEEIVKNYKKAIFLDQKELNESSSELTESLIKNKITLTELSAYVRDNASLAQYLKFNEIIELTVDELSVSSSLEPEFISEVLENALMSTEATGSNFISCTTGRAIGIPLIISSVVLSITSMALSTISKGKIRENFHGAKARDTEKHLNNIADLEFEKVTYESDIIYYNDEIDELERRISSGVYTVEEVEGFQTLIQGYNEKILDANQLINGVNDDISYYHNAFSKAERERIQDEKNMLIAADKKIKAGKILAIPAAITGVAGSVILSIGNQDCN